MTAEHIARRSEREPKTSGQRRHVGRYLDLKALRLAVHGWWLGNPLVYKPDVADLSAVARELAEAGAASGTLILSDTAIPSADIKAPEPTGSRPGQVRAVVVLRPALPRSVAGMAAAVAIAEVTEQILGRHCAVRGHWDVALHDDAPATRVGNVSVDACETCTLVAMRLDVDAIWAVRVPEGSGTEILARPDGVEICVARVLHALDRRLSALAGG